MAIVDLGAIEYGALPLSSDWVSWEIQTLPNPATIEVYPNPARRVIHIKWSGRPQLIHLRIYDVLGRHLGSIYKGLVGEGSTIRADLPRVHPGLYLVVESASGLSAPFVVR